MATWKIIKIKFVSQSPDLGLKRNQETKIGQDGIHRTSEKLTVSGEHKIIKTFP